MRRERIFLSLILFLIITVASSCAGGGDPLTGDLDQPELVPVVNLNTAGVSFDGMNSTVDGAWVTVPPGSSHIVEFNPPAQFASSEFNIKCSSGTWQVVGEAPSQVLVSADRMFEWLAPETSCDIQIIFTPSGSESELQMGIMVVVTPTWHMVPPEPAPIDRIATFTDPATGISTEAAAGELLVKLTPSAPLTSIYNLRSAQDTNLMERVSERQPLFRLRYSENTDLESLINEISRNPNVETVEPNFLAYPVAIPTDPDYYKKHEFPNMDAPLAWDIETGSPDVVVAVIDTGADRNHPDLGANVLPGADFITGGDGDGSETPGDGIDNNQDGMVDQNVGHGTHCAGIIASLANNGEGACGIAYDTKILPLRIFPTNGDTGATFSSIIQAVEYATNEPDVKVISMSIGTTYESALLQSAINDAWAAGKVIVAAACNSNTDNLHYPAAHNNVLSVAAINKSGEKASFSNYGTWVDVSAYGTGIYSTYFDDTYAYMSGTSMACPLVAGCVALLFSYDSNLSNDQAVDAISAFVDDVYELNPSYEGQLGSGMVNPYLALVGLDNSQPGDIGDADGGGDESGSGMELGPSTDF